MHNRIPAKANFLLIAHLFSPQWSQNLLNTLPTSYSGKASLTLKLVLGLPQHDQLRTHPSVNTVLASSLNKQALLQIILASLLYNTSHPRERYFASESIGGQPLVIGDMNSRVLRSLTQSASGGPSSQGGSRTNEMGRSNFVGRNRTLTLIPDLAPITVLHPLGRMVHLGW